MKHRWLVIILVACAAAASAVPFQNGDFETPVLPGGTGVGLGNGNALTGWQATATLQQSWVQVYHYSSGFATLPVSQGNQAVLFNSDGMGVVTLAQTFDTVTSALYRLTFALGREPGGASPEPTLNLAATGNAAGAFVTAGAAFSSRSYDFVAAGPLTTLTFSQSSPPGASPIVDTLVLQQAVAQPFQNGSFEVPVIPSGSQYGLGNSNFLAGWTSTTTNTNISWTQNYLYNPGFDKVSDGAQAVMMNGDGLATTTLSQIFQTVPGGSYTVFFDLGHQGASTGSRPSVWVEVTGSPALQFLVDPEPGFSTRGYSFTALGTAAILTFTQSDGPMDYSPELDNVVLRYEGGGAAIPEPATMGLLAAGLCALARRRRRAAA